MKAIRAYQRQFGFFDLGFSLVLLAVFGATAVVTTTESEQQPPHEIVSNFELV